MEYGECQAEVKPSIYSKYGQYKTIRIINTYVFVYFYFVIILYLCTDTFTHFWIYTIGYSYNVNLVAINVSYRPPQSAKFGLGLLISQDMLYILCNYSIVPAIFLCMAHRKTLKKIVL